MDDYALEPSLDLHRLTLPIDWSSLTKVDLSFDYGLDRSERWTDAAWWHGMRDLLSLARGSLEDLRLSICGHGLPRDASQLLFVDGILGVDFPKLHTLSLRAFLIPPSFGGGLQ
jgi:hypothetical protein